jgi:hypothetical protein
MNRQINTNAPRLSFNQWQSLSSEARTIWSTIPDKDKAVIIRGQQGSENSPSSSTMNRGHPPRAANVHEIVDIDHVDNLGIDNVDSADNIPHESDLVAMVSKQKSNTTPNRKMATPPHDIRQIMSSNTKRDDDGIPRKR